MKWSTTALIAALCCFESGARKITIEHAFSSGTNFSPRGTMDLTIGSEGSPSATLPPVNLGSDAPQLESLIANNELYLIRVATDDTSTRHIVAAIPACHLRLALFKEDITLHIDWDGLIVGLDYKAPVGPLASTRDCTKMPVPESSNIVTIVKVVRPASAQSVPLQVVTDSPPPGLVNLKENIGGQDPKASNNQSILAKYWYIFVPMLVFWMMSPGTPATPGEAGGSTTNAGTQAPGGARGGR